MAKFSGQITLAEVQRGEKGIGINNIVSWYQIFSSGVKPTLAGMNHETFKTQNPQEVDNPDYNWVTIPRLPSVVTEYLWTLQEIILDNGTTQLTEPVICGNAVTAVMNEYSVDGREDGPWDKEYQAGVHQYIRFSYDGGVTWTTPIKVVGLDGTSTATTTYSIIPDYGEVLKFLPTEEEQANDPDVAYVFAPSQIHFSLKKSSATSDTTEPIYIPSEFRTEPKPSNEINKEDRGVLYSHLSISFLSKRNQASDGSGIDYWAGIDLEVYKDAFFHYINGENSEPQLMLDLNALWRIANNSSSSVGFDQLIEIFSEETLIKFELGYWDLIATEAADGTLVYEERKQTFSTFVPVRFAMNKDLATFSVNAHDIHMSIAQAGLNFSGDGLTLTNGKFKILRSGEEGLKPSLEADDYGNVTLRGHVEAESGSFKGKVEAASGVFSGKILAKRGELGSLDIIDSLHIEEVNSSGVGLDIGRYYYFIVPGPIDTDRFESEELYIYRDKDNDSDEEEGFKRYYGENYDINTIVYGKKVIGGIKSTNYSEDGKKGFFLSADGAIYANEMFIGSNARIEDQLQIGENCYIHNPLKEETGSFIKIKDGNGQVPFQLNSEGWMSLGKIFFDGTTSSIYSDRAQDSTLSWTLTPQQAIFNNIVARGSIEASVFKYGEVTAVGGIILARPASKVKAVLVDENNNPIFDDSGAVEITLEEGNGFTEGANDQQNKGYCLFTDRNGLKKEYFEITEIVSELDVNLKENQIFKDFKIKIKSTDPAWENEQYLRLINETLVYIGRTALYTEIKDDNDEVISTRLEREGSVGICINGSDDSASFTTPRAITIYTLGTNYNERVNRIILGQIPDEPRFGRIAGTYGLYGENVYLKGALVTETSASDGATFSGISTVYGNKTDIPTMEGLKDLFPNAPKMGKILLWAGAQENSKDGIENAKFKVDEYGNMYAGSGFFDGSILTNATIEAAKIRTAIIEGSGADSGKIEECGLIIRDVRNGIRFTQTKLDPDNDNNTITETIFDLSSDCITANIPLKVTDLQITGDSPLNLKDISFKDNLMGLGAKENYLSFWNNTSSTSKYGYWRMGEDGLGFYYNNGQGAAIDDWRDMISKNLYRTVNFGKNIIIGEKGTSDIAPPNLTLWGDIILGESAQIVRVEGGFDINVFEE